MVETFKTDRFSLTIGVTPGYFHANESAKSDFVGALATEWQQLMEVDGEKHGIFVPAVATAAKAVYHRNWGCPEGGEHVVAFSGTRNAKFNADGEPWKQTVLRIVEQLKRKLEQKTAQVDFETVEMTYFNFTEEEKSKTI